MGFCVKFLGFCVKFLGFCVKFLAFCVKFFGFCVKFLGFCVKFFGFCVKWRGTGVRVEVFACMCLWFGAWARECSGVEGGSLPFVGIGGGGKNGAQRTHETPRPLAAALSLKAAAGGAPKGIINVEL